LTQFTQFTGSLSLTLFLDPYVVFVVSIIIFNETWNHYNILENLSCKSQDEVEGGMILSARDPSLLLRNPKATEYEFEFPYPKICDFEVPPNDANMEIALFYHVGMINNWKRIVTDQMHTLEYCGLGYMASSLTISYSKPKESIDTDHTNLSTGDATEEITEILNQFRFTTAIRVSFIESTTSPWEKPVMESMARTCRSSTTTGGMEHQGGSVPTQNRSEGQQKGSEKKVFVYYFHNKGVSHYKNDDSVQNCVPNVTSFEYCNAIHWRKYMESFLLERPTLCLRAMLYHGALTCGVNLNHYSRWHYSGNFWAASCDYIATLPPTVELDLSLPELYNYVIAEIWIGYSIFDAVNYTKHVELFQSKAIFPSDPGNCGLYCKVILPQQYANAAHEYRSDLYAGIWSNYTDAIVDARRRVLLSARPTIICP
jgi:hypothetical protein